MEKKRSFPLGRIILHDRASCLAISAIMIWWGFYAIESYFGYTWTRRGIIPITEPDLLFSQIVTIVGIIMLVWRLLLFRALYMRGVEVTGYISLEYILSKKRVEYKYTYQGVDYWRGNALSDSKYRNYFNEGDEVILVVDPQNPKRAVIRDLYF